MKKITIICIIFFQTIFLPAQEITQTIRGSVYDKDTRSTLVGSHIAVYKDTVLITGGTTDTDGRFRIENVPVGRYSIFVSSLGYRQLVLNDIIVNSGKEVILNLEMEEAVIAMDEVVVTAGKKGEAINEMITVSSKTFSVEETDRYAGSRGDPARMASNFAGVQGADDSRNDIVVRGNTPLGVVWRLENVNIPNPNHFGVSGNTGGPVAILNNKVLTNSDFMTGAFPAEYGNSIAGVFDINMRNGNNERHEFSGQFGFLGTEMLAEGPINKEKKSSYLVSYRYSTLAIFHLFGIHIGTDAVPQYQDMAFKLIFPGKKSGTLSFFGVGGYSTIDMIKSEQEDSTLLLYGNHGKDEYFRSGMAVVGMNYTQPVNEKTYFRATLSSSIEHQRNNQDRFERHFENDQFIIDTLYPCLDYFFLQGKHSASFFFNTKYNNRNTVKTGLFTDIYTFSFNDSILNESFNAFEHRLNYDGYSYLLQPYIQWKYKINEKLTLNTGLHGQFFSLNNSLTIEPRAGIRWRVKPGMAIGAGAGMHSQMIPSYIYFAGLQDDQGEYIMANKDIDFIKSNHFVITFDKSFGTNLRMRLEPYYQQLFNIPVEITPSSYSILNEGHDLNRFFPDSLVNEGTGENIGIELTLEKFFSKTYFVMMSTSLYDAKYEGSDGKSYNSAFNGNYILNLLGAKEFRWGKKNSTSFGIGGKLTIAGGKRYTPIDETASDSVGYAIYIDGERNSMQFRDYFRADIKFNYKLNTKKLTHEIGLDLVNVSGSENILKQTYTGKPPPDGPVTEEYQLGFLPIFYYKVDF